MRCLFMFSTLTLLGCASIPSWKRTESPPESIPERVAYWIARIDDRPDPAHPDWTPAVHELIDIGEPALLPTLELMLREDSQETRFHADRVLSGILLVHNGFVFGQGWQNTEDPHRMEEAFRQQWKELGSMDWQASREERLASVELWRKWVADRAATRAELPRE
jgi:hypothetical protein